MKKIEENPNQGTLFEIDVENEKTTEEKKSKHKKRTVQAAAHCAICGKPLTEEKSVRAGIGPICLHKHFSAGQIEYAQNMFMLDSWNGSRKVASYNMRAVSDGIFLFEDRDDDPELPSQTNSIDVILEQLGLDKHENKIVCKGSDGMYALYDGTWSFLGWTEEEALEALR